ncbi:hypothetical protein [Methylorubrum extorquens]|uniref:hypothetical protein n=1 Tax=Methylorubrum extorquens TaxID=408 RepID=UPI0020A01B48|nr:hypothetical protein [Methylorubrum extorquens]MCP1537676.1 hypothetical protein [Methylorubrum extorquens]
MEDIVPSPEHAVALSLSLPTPTSGESIDRLMIVASVQRCGWAAAEAARGALMMNDTTEQPVRGRRCSYARSRISQQPPESF